MGKEQTPVSKQKTTDKKVKGTAKAEITKEKKLKYNYPSNCERGAKKEVLLKNRKKFRHTVRRKLSQFKSKIAKIRTKKIEGSVKEVKSEMKAYQVEVLA